MTCCLSSIEEIVLLVFKAKFSHLGPFQQHAGCPSCFPSAGSAVINLPETPQHSNSDVSIQVVSPSPQSTVAHTPNAQTTPEAGDWLNPGMMGRASPATDFLSVSEPVERSLAAVSPSLIGGHRPGHGHGTN